MSAAPQTTSSGSSTASRASSRSGALSDLPNGVDAAIRLLEVADDEAAMLRAMGIAEGQTVQVLRRAPGGDPLHVRLSSGGEFALARPLAMAVQVERTT